MRAAVQAWAGDMGRCGELWGDVGRYRPCLQAILDGRSRRVDCQQLDMTGLDDKPLRRVSVNTVMALPCLTPQGEGVARSRRPRESP